MIHYISQMYYFCRHKPATTIAILIVAIMVLVIIGTAYAHSRHAGTIALLVMGADFIFICTLIPALFVSGGTAAKEGYVEVYNQMGEEIAQDPYQQNKKLSDWIYRKLGEAGLPLDGN